MNRLVSLILLSVLSGCNGATEQLEAIDCDPACPYAEKRVVKIITGTYGKALVADDGSRCIAYSDLETRDARGQSFSAWRAINWADVGDTFGCRWAPKDVPR
jgi:hypothetical protein